MTTDEMNALCARYVSYDTAPRGVQDLFDSFWSERGR